MESGAREAPVKLVAETLVTAGMACASVRHRLGSLPMK
jgi:hypothetical protein